MTAVRAMAEKRWRGAAIELIYEAFKQRQPAYDLRLLYVVMQRMGHDLGLNDLIFALRLLSDSGYIKFAESKNIFTNEVSISKILLTPEGVHLAEGDIVDPSVTIL